MFGVALHSRNHYPNSAQISNSSAKPPAWKKTRMFSSRPSTRTDVARPESLALKPSLLRTTLWTMICVVKEAVIHHRMHVLPVATQRRFWSRMIILSNVETLVTTFAQCNCAVGERPEDDSCKVVPIDFWRQGDIGRHQLFHFG